MKRKKVIQPLIKQWAAYTFLCSNPETSIPVMDAMRYALYLHIDRILHTPKEHKKRNSSRKKFIQDEQFLVFRFLAKPTKEQDQFLRQSAGNCRFLWNQMVNDFKETNVFSYPSKYKKLKQKQYLAKLHAKAKHQRSDMLHKLSCKLTDTYDLITIEDLDMSAMKQALSFGKSVSDNGWGMFINMLEYKAARKSVLILRVDKWFPSSKTCSHCGHIHKELQLSDRLYICPECGHVMDRDEQAAQNIDEEGLRIFFELQSKLIA